MLDKKWMLKSYARKKISQIMEKTMVDFISVASNIYQFSLSGSTSGDVRWWSCLTLGSLFETVIFCSYLQGPYRELALLLTCIRRNHVRAFTQAKIIIFGTCFPKFHWLIISKSTELANSYGFPVSKYHIFEGWEMSLLRIY